MATRSHKGKPAGDGTKSATPPADAADAIERAKVRRRSVAGRERAARTRARRIPRRTTERKLEGYLTKQGHQTKLTVARIHALRDSVRAGIPLTLAAEALGISRQTLYAWRENHPYIRDIWDKAEAQRAVDAVMMISSAAGEGDWRAAAWWLERRRPEEFLKTQKVQAQVSGDWASLVAELDKPVEDSQGEGPR